MTTKPHPAAGFIADMLRDRTAPLNGAEAAFLVDLADEIEARAAPVDEAVRRVSDQHAAHVEALLRSYVAAGVPLGSFAVIDQSVPLVAFDEPTEVVKRTDVNIDGRLVGSVRTVREGLVYRVTVEAWS